jgi:hypothetical protein
MMAVMDTPEAVAIVEEALAAIDEFHAVYSKASDSEGPAYRKLRDASLDIEYTKVVPRLELARQIAAHIRADELSITSAPDKTYLNPHPYEASRRALVILRTRLAEQERLAAVLGPTGPQLSTSSMHATIWEAAARLFDGGHYRQAVQTAGQALESHLQTIAGPELTGQDLAKLFASSGDGIRLHFSQLDPNGRTYGSAREGAAHLIRGSMMAVRNLVSHPEWPNPSEGEALEMLAVLSYVAHLVDRATLIDE